MCAWGWLEDKGEAQDVQSKDSSVSPPCTHAGHQLISLRFRDLLSISMSLRGTFDAPTWGKEDPKLQMPSRWEFSESCGVNPWVLFHSCGLVKAPRWLHYTDELVSYSGSRTELYTLFPWEQNCIHCFLNEERPVGMFWLEPCRKSHFKLTQQSLSSCWLFVGYRP